MASFTSTELLSDDASLHRDFTVNITAFDRSSLKKFGRRLESAIRAALAENNQDRITKIVWQLCHEYAYAVHHPHARNGGLIGLAAAAIALGAVSTSRTAKTSVY